MKSYFAINHNPDAKDLKQLSQKTGLPKRVLQVSFRFVQVERDIFTRFDIDIYLYVFYVATNHINV